MTVDESIKWIEFWVELLFLLTNRGGLFRGLFLGHSFRSSWTPDKLVTWYLLIPFSKKELKKVRKPGCPLRKMEESKMAAAVCQNWHFQPFWHIFEYFSLVKTCNFMFLMPRNPFLKDLLNFDYSFWSKGQFCSKFKPRALFNDFSYIKTDLLLKHYQSKRKSHDWWAREISALFHRYFAHSVHFKCSFCLP